MNTFAEDFGSGALTNRQPPCISIYLPTHRQRPEQEQDPIRFGNLLRELDDLLLKTVSRAEVAKLMEPLEALRHDALFWSYNQDSLAVFRAVDFLGVYRLQGEAAKRILVGDSFHLKPMLRIFQAGDRFHVLGINRSEVKLYEGSRYVLDEVELHPDVPPTITAALGEETTDPHLTVASYGGMGGTPEATMFHGHGGPEADRESDAERFFRAVDRPLMAHYSNPGNMPLILAGLPDNQQIFRRVSENHHLVENGVEVHPDALGSVEELRKRAWRVMEPIYQGRLAKYGEDFQNQKAVGKGSEDLKEIAAATVAGRVATLLLEKQRLVPGRLDAETGRITFREGDAGQGEEVLDDLAFEVLKRGGEVVFIPAELMPVQGGAAAIYRY